MGSLTLCLVLGIAGVAGPEGVPDVEADVAVRTALERGGYPWYDAKSDSVKPLWPPRERSAKWFDRWFGWLRVLGRRQIGGLHLGELLVTGMVVLALSILLVVLAELWRRYRPISGEPEPGVIATGSSKPVEGLPAGVRPETDDPWSEALQCRARGDYAGAIVCLFAHQLLTLHRLRLLRLAPGRTGRQLVGAIGDRHVRRSVEPTLRLFEAVYYGHLTPSAEAFEAAWTLAEDFERLVAAGPAS
jgi:hypothetical protein